MRKDKVFVILISSVFTVLMVVFCALPRSTYSELERRELMSFPTFSWSRFADGSFNAEVSNWFSDSEPFRDVFMTCSMHLKSWMALKTNSEETVSFHAAAPEETVAEELAVAEVPAMDEQPVEQMLFEEYHNHLNADANAKVANAGVIVVGNAPNARALMAFQNKKDGGAAYAQVVNAYRQTFGPAVKVYCMPIPTAAEFYCPDKARSCTEPEFPILSAFYNMLDDSVEVVDLYAVFSRHVDEDIFLRTDHHWSPLGAYYAARQFAKAAQVKVPDLGEFIADTIPDYVGSMYGYSKDIIVRNSPEDFIYYRPKDVEYTTSYTIYALDEDYNIVSEGKPRQGDFFVPVSRSGMAYCTFMGSDARITKITTDAESERVLMLLKDSFGNAIPGYLFGSFKEIHVVDFRYFTYNVKDYVERNGVTDILITNNLSQICTHAVSSAYRRFLTQTHPSN